MLRLGECPAFEPKAASTAVVLSFLVAGDPIRGEGRAGQVDDGVLYESEP